MAMNAVKVAIGLVALGVGVWLAWEVIAAALCFVIGFGLIADSVK